MNMLFYFEFSCIQILLNIHMNKLLFCKLISNTIYIYICMYVCMYVCVTWNVIFAPLKSDPGSATCCCSTTCSSIRAAGLLVNHDAAAAARFLILIIIFDLSFWFLFQNRCYKWLTLIFILFYKCSKQILIIDRKF